MSYFIAPGVSVTAFYEEAEAATGGFQMGASAVPVSTPLSPVHGPSAATLSLDEGRRFQMQENGKSMKADDFDKWIQANGLRVLRKKP